MIFPKVSHRCQFETGLLSPYKRGGTVKKRETCVIIGQMSAIMRDSAWDFFPHNLNVFAVLFRLDHTFVCLRHLVLLLWGTMARDKGLAEALKRGKLVRDGIKALKVHRAEERANSKTKGNKSSSSSGASGLSLRSHSNPHGIPADPPIPLHEKLSGARSMTLEELMVSERLTYADALVVFENAREGLREQEATTANAKPAKAKPPK